MKQSKKIIHFVTITLIVLVFSCKKISSESDNTVDNKIQIEGEFYPTVNSSSGISEPIKINNSFSKNSSQGIKSINFDMTETDITNLLNSLKDNFSGDLDNLVGVPYLISIYTKPSLNNLKYNKMEALSIMTKDNSGIGGLKHYFFVINNYVTTLIPEFTGVSSRFYFDNFIVLSSLYGSNNSGFVLITSTNPYSYDGVPLNEFNSKIINSLDFDPNGGGIYQQERSCVASKCVEKEDIARCTNVATHGNPVGTWQCLEDNPTDGSGTCISHSMNKIISTNSITSIYPLNIDSISYIRDSILFKYSYGQIYIDFYKKISQFAYYFDAVNFYNSNDSYNFIKETQSVLQKFSNPNSNDIPITSSYKNHAFVISGKFLSLTNNIYYTRIINKFREDITRFEGKTVKEIFDVIQ